MQELTYKEDISIQDLLEKNEDGVRNAVKRVEKELQVLKGEINYSVEEIVELIREDPRFIEKMKDSALRSETFKKKVLQELLQFLEEKNSGVATGV